MKDHFADERACSCIKKVVVDSNGKAIIIPDFKLLSVPDFSITPLDGCFCPRTADELKKCLRGCLLKVLNENIPCTSEIRSVFVLDETGKESEIV